MIVQVIVEIDQVEDDADQERIACTVLMAVKQVYPFNDVSTDIVES